MLINDDERLGFSSRKFNFLTCSGATTETILRDQIDTLAAYSQDIITVTAGGNDAYLVEILNQCVFEWVDATSSWTNECDAALDKAQGRIHSTDFQQRLVSHSVLQKTTLPHQLRISLCLRRLVSADILKIHRIKSSIPPRLS